MRTRILTLAAVAVFGHAVAFAAGGREAPQTFEIDPGQSVVRFTVTKLGYDDVTGVFRESAGQIHWNPSRPEASAIRWHVAVASVLTDASNRDRTLQNPEYFDAARYPALIFESTRVRAMDPGRLEVEGLLTLRGRTRPLTVVVRHSGPPAAPIFETDFEVDRYEFGITGGRVLGRLIGRMARIQLRAVTAVSMAPGTRGSL
jgi:polyisoprenoid-binding protein YceI